MTSPVPHKDTHPTLASFLPLCQHFQYSFLISIHTSFSSSITPMHAPKEVTSLGRTFSSSFAAVGRSRGIPVPHQHLAPRRPHDRQPLSSPHVVEPLRSSSHHGGRGDRPRHKVKRRRSGAADTARSSKWPRGGYRSRTPLGARKVVRRLGKGRLQ